MNGNRTILLAHLRRFFVQDESSHDSGSNSVPIFILFETEVFALIVPVQIFYRSYEKILETSHDRRIAFQRKPLTDFELKIFQTVLCESMRLIRVSEGQIKRFEWPTRSDKSSNDVFQLSFGVTANSIDFKQPDLSSFGSGSPVDLAKALCWEHPRSIAFILSQFDNRTITRILEELPSELRAELAFDLVDFRDRRNQNILKRVNFTEFLAS